ncbi:unannotated protein [freshwater metagenome]|uniref:Unannotated protein n=1 Tax=freshwater metagenome TaxID=449393 RepID=A0A6J6DVE9_9ZZZZ
MCVLWVAPFVAFRRIDLNANESITKLSTQRCETFGRYCAVVGESHTKNTDVVVGNAVFDDAQILRRKVNTRLCLF